MRRRINHVQWSLSAILPAAIVRGKRGKKAARGLTGTARVDQIQAKDQAGVVAIRNEIRGVQVLVAGLRNEPEGNAVAQREVVAGAVCVLRRRTHRQQRDCQYNTENPE